MHLVKFQYAKALLEIADDRNISDAVYDDIKDQVLPAIQVKELYNVLKSPVIPSSFKISCLQLIFKGKVNACLLDLLSLVVNNKRGNALPEILNSYMLQYENERGIKRVKVVTALKLPDVQMNQIKAIALKIALCKEMIVEQVVDKDIIGGYVINVDNKQLDCSLRSDLDRISRKFIGDL